MSTSRSTRPGIWAFLLLFLLSCGGGGSEEEGPTLPDCSTPEGLGENLLAGMTAGTFECANPLYFGEKRITRYFEDEGLAIRTCQALRNDLEQLYGHVEGQPAEFVSFSPGESGVFDLPGGGTLDWVEGTVRSSLSNVSVHVNRIVRDPETGTWCVLLLNAYVPEYY